MHDPTVGVDVSQHNGQVNWKVVRAAGYDFAFIKATEGVGFEDPRFRENWSAAREAGLLTGAYHFARVSEPVEDDAKREAEWFASRLGPMQGRLPPVLDLEWDKRARSISPKQTIAWAQHFMVELSLRTGRVPILYTGPSFWRYKLERTTTLAAYPLWEAFYSSTAQQPKPMSAWKRWSFWQFTSKQMIAGHRFDANRFNGTLNELMAMTVPEHISAPAVDPDAITLVDEPPITAPPPAPGPFEPLLGALHRLFAPLTGRTDR